MNTSVLKGAILSLLAFTSFACSDALTKIAGLDGISPILIVMISGFSAAITILFYTGIKKSTATLRPKKWKPHAILTAVFLAQSFAGVGAFINLPLTTVYVGLFAGPFLISFIGALYMNEPLGFKQAAAIFLGFFGVIIALVPEFLAKESQALGDPIIGYLCLPFFLGLYVGGMLLLRIIGRTETPESVTFISMLGRAAVLLPTLFFVSTDSLSVNLILYIMAVGFTLAFGFLLMTRAYQLAPVAVVSPFHYSQLITGAIFGYVIWETIPSLWVFGGGFIIIASGLIIMHEAQKQGK